MRDSEGGISALFYPGDRDQSNKRGDIIIDCGYSKLFDAMTTEGTFKYIQNIALWTAQYESIFLSISDPEKFRPDSIVFKLKESVEYDGFLPIPKNLASDKNVISPSSLNHRLFAIDTSGSVNNNDFYFINLQQIIDDNYINSDNILTWCSSYELKTKKEISQQFVKRRGSGSTHPSNIIQACIKDLSITRQHLILVTDGCGSKIIHILPHIRKEIIGANQIDFSSLQEIDSIQNLDQFNVKFTALFNATKQKMVGTSGDPQLKSKFDRMNEIIRKSKNITPDFERKINALIRMASGAILNVFDSDQITAMDFKFLNKKHLLN